jgi:hypothetical protein
MSGGNVPVNHSLDGDWDAGGTKTGVYCEGCRWLGKISWTGMVETEYHPICTHHGEVDRMPTPNPQETQNANHDCKDYEGK